MLLRCVVAWKLCHLYLLYWVWGTEAVGELGAKKDPVRPHARLTPSLIHVHLFFFSNTINFLFQVFTSVKQEHADIPPCPSLYSFVKKNHYFQWCKNDSLAIWNTAYSFLSPWDGAPDKPASSAKYFLNTRWEFWPICLSLWATARLGDMRLSSFTSNLSTLNAIFLWLYWLFN